MKDSGASPELSQMFADLQEDNVYRVIEAHLNAGCDPLKLAGELSNGMERVGELFRNDEYALGELIFAGEIFKGAMDRLTPFLKEWKGEPAGRVIMGTVEGDIHDLGKNIVITMLRCSGFEVVDLGVDVSPSKFAEAVRETGAGLVGMSLLLTTAMDSLRGAVRAISDAGLRDRVKIMFGGAPTSEGLKVEVGADFHGRDAIEALAIARRVFQQSKQAGVP